MAPLDGAVTANNKSMFYWFWASAGPWGRPAAPSAGKGVDFAGPGPAGHRTMTKKSQNKKSAQLRQVVRGVSLLAHECGLTALRSC